MPCLACEPWSTAPHLTCLATPLESGEEHLSACCDLTGAASHCGFWDSCQFGPQLRTIYQPGGLYIGPGLEEMLTIVNAAGVPAQNVIMPWGLTQRYSVFGQLMMGIRQGRRACIHSERASPAIRQSSLAITSTPGEA